MKGFWNKGLGWESLVKGPKVFVHLDEGESVSKYQGLKGLSHNSLGFASVLLLNPEFSEVYCSEGWGIYTCPERVGLLTI